MGLLLAAAFCGGTIDAIAGGGGLLTVPALLAVGLPPHDVLGTNKGQSMFGSFAALLRYRHARLVDLGSARFTFPLGFAGALAGTALALLLQPAVLRPIVLVLLILAGIFVIFARPGGGEEKARAARRHVVFWIALAALLIGVYDGFFGPGTGTFLIVAFVGFGGLSLARASADAKVVNFASNLAAAILFASHGVVHWAIALPMAAAQLVGGSLGAHLVVRRGDRLIRAVVFVVVLALVAKVARDMMMQGALRGR